MVEKKTIYINLLFRKGIEKNFKGESVFVESPRADMRERIHFNDPSIIKELKLNKKLMEERLRN
jgi:hypothetical protein